MMTKAQATAEARKRWGKDGWAQEHPDAPANDAEREEARVKLEDFKANHRPIRPPEFEKSNHQRMKNPEYMKWVRAVERPYRARVMELKARVLGHQCSVGNYLYMPGFGNCKATEAEGDTFEACFAKIDAHNEKYKLG